MTSFDEESMPSNDQILASAAQFLIEGNQHEAASILLACTIAVRHLGSYFQGPRTVQSVDIDLYGPRASYDAIKDVRVSRFGGPIFEAIQAVLPGSTEIAEFRPRAQVIEIDSDWRNELVELARGSRIHNQAVDGENLRVWSGLRFRSLTELKVAQALDRVRILFLPNCLARLNLGEERRNREPDFLVCDAGKWGILEVDGDLAHPPSRTVHDHDRDRLFQLHGIQVIQHYDAHRCFTESDKVVEEFLQLLRQI